MHFIKSNKYLTESFVMFHTWNRIQWKFNKNNNNNMFHCRSYVHDWFFCFWNYTAGLIWHIFCIHCRLAIKSYFRFTYKNGNVKWTIDSNYHHFRCQYLQNMGRKKYLNKGDSAIYSSLCPSRQLRCSVCIVK